MNSTPDYVSRHLNIFKRFWIQLGLADAELLHQVEDKSFSKSEDPIYKAFHNLLWGKFYATEGELIKAKKHIFMAEQTIRNMVKTTVLTIRKNDFYAYILMEVGIFYRMLFDYDHSRQNFSLATLFCESEKLAAVINCTQEVYRFHRFYDDSSTGDLDKLAGYLEVFRKENVQYAMVNGLYNRFAIKVDLGLYDEAYDDYFDGSALSENLELDTFVSAFAMGLGYMMQKQGEYQEALKLYNKAFENTQSWHRKSLCLENISTVYEHYKNFEKSIEYQLRSLEICEKHGVMCNIPADCYYIGKSYENNFKDLKKAEQYYKRGHDLAIKLRDEGIHLSAFNQKIITQYTEFVTKFYVKEAKDENYEHYLQFALNSTWRQIKDTFHYNLLMFHRAKTESSNLLLEKLGLKMSTLQAIQRRLSEAGFNIPDFRFLYSRNVEVKLEPGLEAYLDLISELDWKDANVRFENDVIAMLLRSCNNNKSALRDCLKLSYATVISLTKGTTNGNLNHVKETG